MSWSAAIGAGGAIIGGYLNSKGANKSGEQIDQRKLDPRFDNLMFGSNGRDGIFGQYQSLLNQPQDSRLQDFGNANLNYLSSQGGANLGQMTQAADRLMNPMQVQASGVAPPAWAQGSMVNAPSQNSINLTPTFNSLLSGGNNAALRDSLKYGADLTGAQFQKNQTDLTNNLTRNVLPGIRHDAVLTGQYGSSRQGIAEGNALSDYTNQLTNANTQIGLANSANTTGQMANSYEQGQNRALSAAQGLSGQQYATAFKNADTQNAAEFMNVANHNNINENYANRAQQAQLANQQAGMTGALQGANLLGGINSGAYTAGQNMDNYALGRAQAFNGLMTPWAAMTGSSTMPLYQNKGGNMLGGAMMGSQLFGGMFGGGSSGGSNMGGIMDLFGKNSSFSGGGYF